MKNMNGRTLLERIEFFVEEIFSVKISNQFCFHDFQHTKQVVLAAKQLAQISELGKDDTEILLIAAWFHDTGFVDTILLHEHSSSKYAEDFLEKEGFSQLKIQQIKNIILSTQATIIPQTLVEKLLKDADLSHIGSENYFQRLILLRKEWELTQQKVYSDNEWFKMNASFLKNHQFFSPVAEKLYSKQKEINMLKINTMFEANQELDTKQEKKRREKKEKQAERGIETLFRVTIPNHTQLSQIADNKANIMLSVNAIIISIVLSSLLPQWDTQPKLIIPSLMLLVSAVTSVICATIATIPKVSQTHVTRADVENRTANIIFFGNFQSMSLHDFDWGMKQVMEDPDYLYGSMIKDLYFLGKVLHRKYKFLRLTYTVFMIGMCMSVISFLIAFFI
jgi:HD superfamily phosphodiesterase